MLKRFDAKVCFLWFNILLWFLFVTAGLEGKPSDSDPMKFADKLICKIEKIEIDLPGLVYNPSLLDAGDGKFLFCFRYQIDMKRYPYISNIGIVLLNEDLSLAGEPQLLNTRPFATPIPSQSEDARLFCFRGEPWLIWNDNIEEISPTRSGRRDMFIAKLLEIDGKFSLGPILKLFHTEKWEEETWQKNWTPFEYGGKLMISYSFSPHEVLEVNLLTGAATPVEKTDNKVNWPCGVLRGGTATELLDGEYFTFFHSAHRMRTLFSTNQVQWHYFMGACTFSVEAPFNLTKISPAPIIDPRLYAPVGERDKLVVFPGGCVIRGSKIYLAVGKDDVEAWIVVLDRDQIMRSLIKLEEVE